MEVVYHWTNGAYINSYDPDFFEEKYKELCDQYGPPCIAICY